MRFFYAIVTLFVISTAAFKAGAQPTCGQIFKRIEPAKLPKELVDFPPQPESIKTLSEKTLKSLETNIPKVEAEIKALGYKQAVGEMHFRNGSLFIDAGNLMWKGLDGQLVKLVDKLEHPDRGIDQILVSPDGKKVAYSTTLSLSDQHVWYVKTIAAQSSHLLKNPLLVRMDGFSWGQNSSTIYFSHFAKLEDAIAKKKPIHTVRSLNLNTGRIRNIFKHNEHANFAVYDVDGGNTLIVHRILGPGAGIKALLSVHKGVKQSDGSYKWNPLIAPNSTMGHFLGVIDKNGESFAVMHTNQFGKKYGIAMIPLSAKSPGAGLSSVVNPQKRLVLHNSQMLNGKLFLEYFDPVNLRTSMHIADAATGGVEKVIRFSDYGVLNNGGLSLPVSFDGPEVTFKYADVLGNARTFSYNVAKKSVVALKNPQPNPFNTAQVRVAVESFKSQDGTTVRGLKIYPVDPAGNPVKPKFFFMKSYGMIGIKYVAEALEAQLVLQRGGVYFVPDVRGGAGPNSDWQVQGSRDFNLRYQDMMAAATYITQLDPMYAKYGFDPKKDLVALGRSYNGAGILNVAARYPEMARMFVSVVPLWDPSRSLREQPFGLIAHSDYFPNIDPKTGNLILDADFFARIEEHNPVNILNQIPKDTTLVVFTGGRDDRVGQYHLEEGYIQTLLNRLGSNLHYIQNPTASHIPRWYFEELFSMIDQTFP